MLDCNLTISDVFQAYYDCRKAKRNTWNALIFEQNLERNLMDLYYELRSGEYQPSRSIMFVITRPKAREVWAANFKDRIVHHILYNKYANHFYRRFIFDSYACIPGKGTLRASNRVQYFIKAATKNHTEQAWFLKCDIANFFVSINKDILFKLLSKHITDKWWLDLTKKILYKDAKENVYIKSNDKLLQKVPKHKSLLNANENYGLPIGNLSSQFFANVYLDALDQYVKHKLKIKYYARYVDDIVLIADNPNTLNEAYKKMEVFVHNELEVKFHPNKKELNTVNVGINFVGYIIKPRCKYIRRTTIDNLYIKSKLKYDFESLRATVNSYYGIMRHGNAYNERKRAAKKLGKLGCWFDGKLTKMVKLGEVKCI